MRALSRLIAFVESVRDRNAARASSLEPLTSMVTSRERATGSATGAGAGLPATGAGLPAPFTDCADANAGYSTSASAPLTRRALMFVIIVVKRRWIRAACAVSAVIAG